MLFIGAAFIYFAPEDLRWIGFILLAAWVASLFIWIFNVTNKRVNLVKARKEKLEKDKQLYNHYVDCYYRLSDVEKSIVNHCVNNSILVFSWNLHDTKNAKKTLQEIEAARSLYARSGIAKYINQYEICFNEKFIQTIKELNHG